MRRRLATILVLSGTFLFLGLPRWLERDVGTAADSPAARFAEVCRQHGGSPEPSSPDAATQGVCTVRYGPRIYRMDAITADGFDLDAARFQRRGCVEALRLDRAAPSGGQPPSFVYHARTGVCERRR